MATAEDIINRALRLAGIIAAGEGGNPEELEAGRISLNAMLYSWSTDRLMIYAKRRDIVNLANGVQTYTVGIGGAINIPRPLSLLSVSLISTSALALPVDLIQIEDWQKIVEKSVQGQIPRKLYNDQAFPLSTFYVWPIPIGAPALDIASWVQLSQFAAISDTFNMAPGYELAVVSQLATQIAPEYGRQVTPDVARIATEAKASIQKLNLPPSNGTAQEAMARAQVPPTMPPNAPPVMGRE